MMPVIRISDEVFGRLQKHATPFVDTPASVIDRLLDAYEATQKGAAERKKTKQVEAANEFWFVNVGESSSRNWDDCIAYGFLSAGWEPKYSKPMKKLAVGSKVFAYLNEHGYVGYGEVTQAACPVEEFIPDGYGKPLLELPLQAEEMGHSPGNHDKCEWVVGIEWHKTFARDQAKTFRGIFAKPHIVCSLQNQPETVAFLTKEFDISDEEG